ncbi:MAG TPA: ABC transporter permease [Dehalococcoidia bacterium]|jgi:peptide/nickel transport system permease protein|nr:ABC transporter permease [Dehalococcoidia bacterium]
MATAVRPAPRAAAETAFELPRQAPLLLRLARPWLRNPLGLIGLIIVVVFVVAGVLGPALAPHDPRALGESPKFLSPSFDHPFGTDRLGRDIFSRTLSGARLSLTFGALVLLMGFIPGSALGILSGYFGRWVDYLIQRSGEAWTAFPQLPILLTVIAAVGPGLKAVVIVVAIGAIFGGSRLLRAVALVEKHKDYVLAARSLGGSEGHILRVHIVPNIMPYILVGASSVFAVAVLAEASLSFLGLGVQPGTPGWGIDLADGRGRATEYPHVVLFYGLVISVVVLGFNLLGDTLRDILDPRLRGSR